MAPRKVGTKVILWRAPGTPGQLWLTVAAALVLLLAVVDMVLVEMNRPLQLEVNRRDQYIKQTVQLESLSRELVTAIANFAIRDNDEALRGVLTQHGIAINLATGAAPAPGATQAPRPAQAGPRR
jgi:hypothetical protein